MSDDNFKDQNNPDISSDISPAGGHKTTTVQTPFTGKGQQTVKWVDRLRQQWDAEQEAKNNGNDQNQGR